MIVKLHGLYIHTKGILKVKRNAFRKVDPYIVINYDFGGYTIYFKNKRNLLFWYLLLKIIVFLHL